MLKQIGLLVLIFAGLSMYVRADTKQDEEALRQILSEYEYAFNKHDPHKMASFWTEDGDLITIWGELATNRNDVKKILTKNMEGIFKNASLVESVEYIRFVNPNVALIDVDSVISHMKDNQGKELAPLTNHGFYVLAKRNGKWQIVAFRAYALKELN